MAEMKDILWFVMAILLMGFFAGMEMAFYSANRLGIELKKKQGHTSGIILAEFFETPVRFLTTTLICFNLLLVFFGLQFAVVMRPVWLMIGVGSPLVQMIVEIAICTFILLIFVEFIPRAIFRARSNSMLYFFSRVIHFFYQVFYPIGASLIHMSEWLLRYLFNVRMAERKEAFKYTDYDELFQQFDNGNDEKQEMSTELFENALELPKIKIRQCLVPRKEIMGLEASGTIEELTNKFIETKLSKLIIYENNIDHITGYVHQLDLFRRPKTIQEMLLPIPAVPESMSATDLIEKFSTERKSMAWVVDEFGGTAGIITMEDVLEEIFGEIKDEYDTEEFVEKQIAENEYIFSGRLELDYLINKYGLEFETEESETLSGYIINYHETIPQQKERIIIDDYEFDVLNVSDTRIETVKMRKLK